MQYLKPNMLKPGMIAATPIYTNRKRPIIAANQHLTDQIIAEIQAMHLNGLYTIDNIDEEYCKAMLYDAKTHHTIDELQKLNPDQTQFVVNIITTHVLQKTSKMYNMRPVFAYDQSTYIHSINTTVLSILIGITMIQDENLLTELGEAALLHDIGKIKVNPEIIKGTQKLTKEEFEEVQKHPNFGYNMLINNPKIPEIVRQGVLCHHENEDGTGYPNNLTAEDIPLIAKIIHVTDVYDAMVGKRSYKDEINPIEVMEYLKHGIGTRFNAACVQTLCSNITQYPLGQGSVA